MKYVQSQSIDNLLALGLQERIHIVEKLWQSILREMKLDSTKISSEQIAEINIRLAKLEKGESELYSWQEVRRAISTRK